MFRSDGPVCPECGQLVASPAIAAQAAERAAYGRTIRQLGLWFVIFAALNVGLGAAALIGGFASHKEIVGPFEPWPHAPLLAWTYLGSSAWVLLTMRVFLALVAAAGLRTHAPWGRRMGAVAAAVAVTQFPIGLLFGAYALVRLMGPRNAVLYAALTGPSTELPKLQAR